MNTIKNFTIWAFIRFETKIIGPIVKEGWISCSRSCMRSLTQCLTRSSTECGRAPKWQLQKHTSGIKDLVRSAHTRARVRVARGPASCKGKAVACAPNQRMKSTVSPPLREQNCQLFLRCLTTKCRRSDNKMSPRIQRAGSHQMRNLEGQRQPRTSDLVKSLADGQIMQQIC